MEQNKKKKSAFSTKSLNGDQISWIVMGHKSEWGRIENGEITKYSKHIAKGTVLTDLSPSTPSNNSDIKIHVENLIGSQKRKAEDSLDVFSKKHKVSEQESEGKCASQFDENGIQQIAMNELNLHEILGKGAFGEVYRASWHRLDVAVKFLYLDPLLSEEKKKDALDSFLRELQLLK